MINIKSLPLFFLTCILSVCATAQLKHDDLKKKQPTVQRKLDYNPTHEDSARYNMKKGKLKGKPITIDVYYGAILCTCAQWTENITQSDPKGESEYFYLERANSTLMNADTLFNGTDFPVHISVTGQFYEKDGYPKDYFPAKGSPDPARVFRYSRIKTIEIGKNH